MTLAFAFCLRMFYAACCSVVSGLSSANLICSDSLLFVIVMSPRRTEEFLPASVRFACVSFAFQVVYLVIFRYFTRATITWHGVSVLPRAGLVLETGLHSWCPPYSFGPCGRICTCTCWFLKPVPLLLGYARFVRLLVCVIFLLPGFAPGPYPHLGLILSISQVCYCYTTGGFVFGEPRGSCNLTIPG